MRVNLKLLHLIAAVILLLLGLGWSGDTVMAEGGKSRQEIGRWQVLWNYGDKNGIEVPLSVSEGWLDAGSDAGFPQLPKDAHSAWTRIQLPQLGYISPALYVHRMYAMQVKVYIEDQLIFESSRDYIKDHYAVLVPLSEEDAGRNMYIWTYTLQDRIGIKEGISIGEHQELLRSYIQCGISDVLLGGAFVFLALVLFVCAFFLKKDYFAIVSSLSAVIASTGIISITYSPFVYSFYSNLGAVSISLFDLALFSLLPSLTYLFELIFREGRYRIIRRFRKFQVGYSLFCAAAMAVNLLSGNRYMELYYFLSTNVLGIVMILQFLLLIAFVVSFSLKGNKDAMIFAFGFGTAAVTGVAELLWYYKRQGDYDLTYWNWSLILFILSLIVIMGRKLANDHKQVVRYTQELELFNNELQRSEKMEIISELAASVAHEVRNPLQVTRGFLQLITEKTSGDEQRYLFMALSELDRASHIITDFLTFAKPESVQISHLNVQQEFQHIRSILLPLCHLNNGKMELDMDDRLWVKGNSSKFKQAYINIIKNSIESLRGEGLITIRAYTKTGRVYIHIRDNGEGMDQGVLSRLGEPYFSNKTKGTGLGLMVTFRIIEAMGGEIRFTSKKGAGTESITILPQAEAPEDSSPV